MQSVSDAGLLGTQVPQDPGDVECHLTWPQRFSVTNSGSRPGLFSAREVIQFSPSGVGAGDTAQVASLPGWPADIFIG